MFKLRSHNTKYHIFMKIQRILIAIYHNYSNFNYIITPNSHSVSNLGYYLTMRIVIPVRTHLNLVNLYQPTMIKPSPKL